MGKEKNKKVKNNGDISITAAKLLKMRSSGMSLVAIASKLGISKTTSARWFKEAKNSGNHIFVLDKNQRRRKPTYTNDQVAALLKNNNQIETAKITGLSPRTISSIKQGINTRSKRSDMPDIQTELEIEIPISKSKIDQLFIPRKLSEHAVVLNMTVEDIEDILDQARQNGMDPVWNGSMVYLEPVLIRKDDLLINDCIYRGSEYTFGAIGDTHLGSNYERLDCLNEFYDLCHEEGVNTIFHAGNIIEGESPRIPGHKNDLKAHGFEGQVKYCIENYPQRKGIKTKFITADDHEGWIIQMAHINVGHAIQRSAEEAGRKDLEFIGHVERNIKLKEHYSPIRIAHPGGGTALAVSYKAQKIVDSLTGGTKPSIYLCHTPETKITMENLTQKQIKDVAVGDRVLCHNGEIGNVEHVKIEDYNGYVVSVKSDRSSNNVAACTPDHKVYARRHNSGQPEWVEARHVQKGDWLLTPKPGMCTDPSNEMWWMVRDIGVERYKGKVYDLIVPDHNSYVAGFIAVHNCGHFHKADFLPSYRNVAIFQVGCFQDQTLFMRKKNLAAHLGGWIITVRYHEESGALMRIKGEFIKFFDRDWYKEDEPWEYHW